MEVRLVRRPVDPRVDRVVEGRPDLGIALLRGATVELDVAAGVVLVTRHTVHRQPWVPEEIAGLVALPHHPEEQATLGEVDLARADPRRAVGSDRPEHHELVGPEALVGELRDRWARGREFVPAHGRTLAERCAFDRPARGLSGWEGRHL